MNALDNKKIVLGVSGGIAAYKACELCRRLIDEGCEVTIVMTASATEFVSPLTFQALSGKPVHLDLLNPEAEAAMGHIELAKWADLILIAPATANRIAQINAGMAADLLNTLCLASEAPLVLAPAMNQAMWRNSATQANVAQLESRGITMIGPASGEQACGDVGPGRMEEPHNIIAALRNLLSPKPLAGLKIAINAGPTREAIDPVRYISNHSSGKMGYALANAAALLGAEVTLISGPCALTTPHQVKRINVESAQQMCDASIAAATQSDMFIASAAVADYRPENTAEQKLKKQSADQQLTITMKQTSDIVAGVAALENKPFTVGFAAETQNVESYARDKLQRKGLDMIVANDVSQADIGFNSDNNAVHLFWPEGDQQIAIATKQNLAYDILLKALELLQSSKG